MEHALRILLPMLEKNLTKHIETSSALWIPFRLEGIEYLPLRTDVDERRGTFLFRMPAGTTYPRHRHPAGEEILVLKGEMMAGERRLKAGDFLYSPPASVHELITKEGCVFLEILPEPMQVLSTMTIDEIESIPDIAESGGAPASDEPFDPSLREIPTEEEPKA
ncbi:MAG: cupin domain-containing protein [Pseudomonadota bacterium]